MSKRQHLTVNLPNHKPTVTLPLQLGKTLQHVIESGTKGISTLELTEAGCLNPANAISDIRKQGALIMRELRPAEDSRGEVHRRVAHYTYCGWHLDSSWQQDKTNPSEDLV
jgi:hypothetical protein